jgi:hypothetical protein
MPVKLVMPGLVPGVHVHRAAGKIVDGRDKPGHDDVEAIVRKPPSANAIAPAQEEQKVRDHTPAIITYLISTYSSMP